MGGPSGWRIQVLRVSRILSSRWLMCGRGLSNLGSTGMWGIQVACLLSWSFVSLFFWEFLFFVFFLSFFQGYRAKMRLYPICGGVFTWVGGGTEGPVGWLTGVVGEHTCVLLSYNSYKYHKAWHNSVCWVLLNTFHRCRDGSPEFRQPAWILTLIPTEGFCNIFVFLFSCRYKEHSASWINENTVLQRHIRLVVLGNIQKKSASLMRLTFSSSFFFKHQKCPFYTFCWFTPAEVTLVPVSFSVCVSGFWSPLQYISPKWLCFFPCSFLLCPYISYIILWSQVFSVHCLLVCCGNGVVSMLVSEKRYQILP